MVKLLQQGHSKVKDMALLHRVHQEYWAKSGVDFAWLEAGALEDDWYFALRVSDRLIRPWICLLSYPRSNALQPQDTQRRRTWDSPTLLLLLHPQHQHDGYLDARL